VVADAPVGLIEVREPQPGSAALNPSPALADISTARNADSPWNQEDTRMSDNKAGILLEAGTNELEVLVFTLGKLRCGVNVAKVREVIGSVQIVRMPQCHPAVVGVANLRGQVISVVDLQLYFEPGCPSEAETRHLIITEFNNILMGFLVDGVEQIYRLGWDQVDPAPGSGGQEHAAVTSICHVDESLVLMIDFEKIAFDIAGISLAAQQVTSTAEGFRREEQRVLLAEDSPTMRQFIVQTLHDAGYRNLVVTGDGQEAWEQLTAAGASFDVLVSDIEMPRMDGLHLCKRVRQDPSLCDMVLVIFSSLVSSDNLKKMDAVGADETLTKPQLAQLVEILDRLIERRIAQPA
jgi:two-component system chemotaxis response regulator CheV